MQYSVELTDTFGGDANFSWVQRATIEASDKARDCDLIRQAKKALGMTGLRHVKAYGGDMIRLDFPRANMVMFIESPWQAIPENSL